MQAPFRRLLKASARRTARLIQGMQACQRGRSRTLGLQPCGWNWRKWKPQPHLRTPALPGILLLPGLALGLPTD